MNILVFDTCFNKSYIVLQRNNEIVESKIIESTDSNYHSVYLIPTIKNILFSQKMFIKDLDAVGVNIGPGSFTGIRAGITVARVLCQQFNLKLIGVSSLKILSFLNNSNTAVVLDARKNKVYYAQYSGNIEVVSPKLVDKDELCCIIPQGTCVISDSSINEYLSAKGINSINFESNDNNLGLFLAQEVSYLLNNIPDDYNWAKVKPLYIQQPSITKPKENSHV